MNRRRVLIRLPRSGEELIALIWLGTIAVIAIVGLTYDGNRTGIAPPETRPASLRVEQSPPSVADWLLSLTGIAAAMVALLTLNTIREQVKIARREASAAKSSADTADRSLRLANRPTIDIEKLRVRIRQRSTGEWELDVVMRIYNAGQVPARFLRIGTVYRVPRPPTVTGSDSEPDLTSSHEVTRGPGRGFEHVIGITDLTTWDLAQYDAGRLLVEFQLRVELEDAFGESRWHLFTRRVLCGPDHLTSVLINDATNGWNRRFKNELPTER